MGEIQVSGALAAGAIDRHAFLDAQAPTGFIESISRGNANGGNMTTLLSGKLHLQLIALPAGLVVTNISWASADTALGTPTNWWFALYTTVQAGPVLLRQTADQTSTAWGTNTLKTVALSSAYTTTAAGAYYAGVMCAGAAMPTLLGAQHRGSQVLGMAPIFAGDTADVGLTTTAPATAGAMGSGTTTNWCAVS